MLQEQEVLQSVACIVIVLTGMGIAWFAGKEKKKQDEKVSSFGFIFSKRFAVKSIIFFVIILSVSIASYLESANSKQETAKAPDDYFRPRVGVYGLISEAGKTQWRYPDQDQALIEPYVSSFGDEYKVKNDSLIVGVIVDTEELCESIMVQVNTVGKSVPAKAANTFVYNSLNSDANRFLVFFEVALKKVDKTAIDAIDIFFGIGEWQFLEKGNIDTHKQHFFPSSVFIRCMGIPGQGDVMYDVFKGGTRCIMVSGMMNKFLTFSYKLTMTTYDGKELEADRVLHPAEIVTFRQLFYWDEPFYKFEKYTVYNRPLKSVHIPFSMNIFTDKQQINMVVGDN